MIIVCLHVRIKRVYACVYVCVCVRYVCVCESLCVFYQRVGVRMRVHTSLFVDPDVDPYPNKLRVFYQYPMIIMLHCIL